MVTYEYKKLARKRSGIEGLSGMHGVLRFKVSILRASLQQDVIIKLIYLV